MSSVPSTRPFHGSEVIKLAHKRLNCTNQPLGYYFFEKQKQIKITNNAIEAFKSPFVMIEVNLIDLAPRNNKL